MPKRFSKKIALTGLILLSSIDSLGSSIGNSDTTAPVSSSSAAPNMQQSSQTAKSSNGMAGALSKVIGAANIGLGVTQIKTGAATKNYGLVAQGIIHIGMGALSFQQAGQHAGAENGAAMTGFDTSAWDNAFGTYTPGTTGTDNPGTDLIFDPKDPLLKSTVNVQKLNDLQKKLTTSGIGGVKLNPKTGKITDSNSGKTYDISQMSDAGKMAQAGFSGSDISSAMSDAAAIEKAAMKKLGIEGIGSATAENGYTEGGAMGASASAGNLDDGSNAGAYRGLASGGGAVKIPSNQIAGLTKNFNGERIGVAAENIFNMMARRYKTKEKQNSFFDHSELVKMPQ